MSSESNECCLSKDTDAEVELISLTFEKLPKYRLRADSNIQFAGYQHSDFKRATQVKDEVTELSNQQIEKTLEYFLLCGLRVTRMTETYEDCAALRLLVEEQKAHMDEAANIGLNLLQRNIQLEQRLATVEEQLSTSKDTINQLRHQLHLKDDLLRLLHNEIEEAEDTGTTQIDLLSTESSFTLEKVNLKKLEVKLNKLEEENTNLRKQQLNLNTHTDFLENKEQQLIDDCVRQLLDSTKTVDRLSTELNKKTNDYLNQHEEISRLLTTNIDLENKIHQLLTENDNLITQLRDQQTKQFTLTKEVTDLRDRYDECINLLNEKQDHIRLLKKKCKKEMIKQIQGYRPISPDTAFAPSLAMEFEDSSRKDLIFADQSRAIRMMEQAKTINSSWLDPDETSSGFTEDLSCSMMNTDMDISVQEPTGGNYLLRKSIQDDCEKRRIYKCNAGEVDSSMLESQMEDISGDTVASYCTLEAFRHRQSRCQAIRSLNTNILNSENNLLHPQNFYRNPDKLQLVKPIEGSQTLRTWQNLATPSITKALFEEQSQSVCFRGQQPLLLSPSPSSKSERSNSSDIHASLHSSVISSDYEDVDCDDQTTMVVSKNPSYTSTYTYTNSRMLYPTNEQVSSVAFQNGSGTRKETTPTFSLNLELSNAVNERDRTRGVSYQDDTPVNEMVSEDAEGDNSLSSSLPTHNGKPSVNSPVDNHRTMPSWLDRITVKSIMTNILGYPLPQLHLTGSSSSSTVSYSQKPIVSTTVASASANSSSIIGRLTNLPPLAQRRFPQSGLNLLTSMASDTPSRSAVFHRAGNFDATSDTAESIDDPCSPDSNLSQLD